MEDITLGQYGLPVLLTIFLALIYKFVPVEFPDKYKSLIAILVGIGLSLVAVWYKGLAWTPVVIVDHVLYGLMLGASAVGIYELQRTATNPRE